MDRYRGHSRQMLGYAPGFKRVMQMGGVVDYPEGIGSSQYVHPDSLTADSYGGQRDAVTGRTWQINRGRGLVGRPLVPETMQRKHIYNPFLGQATKLMEAADSYVRKRQGGFIRSTHAQDIQYMKKLPHIKAQMEFFALLNNTHPAQQAFY